VCSFRRALGGVGVALLEVKWEDAHVGGLFVFGTRVKNGC